MKSLVRTIIPIKIMQSYYRLKRYSKRMKNRQKTTSEVFSEIYESSEWGNGQARFDSGSGSSEDRFIVPYCEMLSKFLDGLNGEPITLVDLGCGDFRVGSQLIEKCSNRIDKYIGIDIVLPLIQHHQSVFADEKIEFSCLNIIEDKLPAATVCTVRQVLQHLSNDQISQILKKLVQYQYVFITEHYPTDSDLIIPNIDKPHGGDIRLFDNSGVYLNHFPFNIPEYSMELVLEVPGHEFFGEFDPGVLRTYRIEFSQ